MTHSLWTPAPPPKRRQKLGLEALLALEAEQDQVFRAFEAAGGLEEPGPSVEWLEALDEESKQAAEKARRQVITVDNAGGKIGAKREKVKAAQAAHAAAQERVSGLLARQDQAAVHDEKDGAQREEVRLLAERLQQEGELAGMVKGAEQKLGWLHGAAGRPEKYPVGAYGNDFLLAELDDLLGPEWR